MILRENHAECTPSRKSVSRGHDAPASRTYEVWNNICVAVVNVQPCEAGEAGNAGLDVREGRHRVLVEDQRLQRCLYKINKPHVYKKIPSESRKFSDRVGDLADVDLCRLLHPRCWLTTSPFRFFKNKST